MFALMLISISTFAGDKNKKHKKEIAKVEQTPIQQSAVIAEVYVNASYKYLPVGGNSTVQAANSDANNPNIIKITKDDYQYCFRKTSTGFEFLYAVKDNNIPLFDGFEYENEVKIPIGNQQFSFNMYNGRPVEMNAENIVLVTN